MTTSASDIFHSHYDGHAFHMHIQHTLGRIYILYIAYPHCLKWRKIMSSSTRPKENHVNRGDLHPLTNFSEE